MTTNPWRKIKNKEKLNITGEWSSPDGKKKQFKRENALISWWKNEKFLAINWEKSSLIVDALLKYIGENYNLINSEEEKHSSPCRCAELSTDIEGIKLDQAIAEARIKTNKVKISEICREIRESSNNAKTFQNNKQEERVGIRGVDVIISDNHDQKKSCQDHVDAILELVLSKEQNVERN